MGIGGAGGAGVRQTSGMHMEIPLESAWTTDILLTPTVTPIALLL
jgi:hypothetical protein